MNIPSQINQAKIALRDVMQTNLSKMADDLIEKVMNKYASLNDESKSLAIDGITATGPEAYRKELLEALAVISADAIDQAKTDLKKPDDLKMIDDQNSLMFGEFENLPSEVKKRLLATANLIIQTQTSDLEKAIFFQFGHSNPSTTSAATIKEDLQESAADFVGGNAIEAGATTIASQSINEARQAFFFDKESLDEVDAFEFVNGDPVTTVCNELAGKLFLGDDEESWRYTPPLHFNCKSYIIPVLKGNLKGREITGLRPSEAAKEDIQFSEGTIADSKFNYHKC